MKTAREVAKEIYRDLWLMGGVGPHLVKRNYELIETALKAREREIWESAAKIALWGKIDKTADWWEEIHNDYCDTLAEKMRERKP